MALGRDQSGPYATWVPLRLVECHWIYPGPSDFVPKTVHEGTNKGIDTLVVIVQCCVKVASRLRVL